MMRMAHHGGVRESSNPTSRSPKTVRADIRQWPLRYCKNFTTESAENHGGPRRFFGCEGDGSNHTPESISAFLIFYNAAASFMPGANVRAVGGPVAPWSSVVLGVLRGKAWRSWSSTPAHVTTREPFAPKGVCR